MYSAVRTECWGERYCQHVYPPRREDEPFPYTWASTSAPLAFVVYVALIVYFARHLIRYIKEGPGG